MEKDLKSNVYSGIYGALIGDALGLPHQFLDRSRFDEKPVTKMDGYGAFGVPAGFWSDDGALTLATLDGLSKKLSQVDLDMESIDDFIDYDMVMENFEEWLFNGEFTPDSYAFDIGGATQAGIKSYHYYDTEAILSGGIGERDNGNGSLMRILPAAYFIHYLSKNNDFALEDELEIVHNLSSLTHRHRRSQMACGIYILIADEFLKGGRDLESMITDGLKRAQEFYTNDERFESELSYFDRVFSYDIQNLPRDEISSSGYVLSSLEASIWCILNTGSYKDCILKAVNLGFDTDTTACIVGGLAGIYYGYDNLPGEWIDTMVEKDYIDEIIDDFVDSLSLFVK